LSPLGVDGDISHGLEDLLPQHVDIRSVTSPLKIQM